VTVHCALVVQVGMMQVVPWVLPVQSALPRQAHTPLTQLLPFTLPEQPTHAAPVEPHEFGVTPATHRPEVQQPPLHTVWLAPPQAVEHWCVEVLQA
jgi:hypothetical protein